MVLRLYAFIVSLLVFSFLQSCTQPEMVDLNGEFDGKLIYEYYCVSCHGLDGKLMASGAANLSSSKLEFDELKKIVLNGKNSMPAYRNVIKEEAAQNQLFNYLKKLREN